MPHQAVRSRSALISTIAATLTVAWACGDNGGAPTAPDGPELAAVAAPLSFESVVAGASHTCGITTAGRAFCWGNNLGGELGNGTNVSSSRPVPVAGGLSFIQLTAGSEYTCGITTTKKAYCWGSNTNGQLGTTAFQSALRPAPVAGGHNFRQIRAGFDHTCAVTPSDVGFCWGQNRFGELGINTTTDKTLVPVRVVGGLLWDRIVAGGHSTCGVTTGNRAYCWGNNDDASLGDGTTTHRRKPVPVLGGLQFRLIVPGGGGFADMEQDTPESQHTCGVTTDSKGYCWGQGGNGELGAGTISFPTNRPIAIAGNRKWTQVIAGWVHSCGVTTANAAYCWGDNFEGELGNGSTVSSNLPVLVAGNHLFVGVTTGTVGDHAFGSHTCGLTTSNRVYCWGLNESGQLGDGSKTNRLSPVPVVGP
jgi:alpha-tubulin suppressor-like RCC1 family protein